MSQPIISGLPAWSLDDAPPGPPGLAHASAYGRWREHKLAAFPATADEIRVDIRDLSRPSEEERRAIVARARRCNFAIYAERGGVSDATISRSALASLAHSLGLRRLEAHRSSRGDGFVALEVSGSAGKSGYIPYTNRPLNWHTDGYYNAPRARIRAFILHCARDAAKGGENALFDPEIAYIRLRDKNPDYVAALMHPQAMTIPENLEPDGRVRAASIGPVFSFDPTAATLHMRYTARKRNIIWRDDPMTTRAVGFLGELLTGDGDPSMFRVKLAPGEGVICNNVLHNRSGFEEQGEGEGRLYFRARYLDRISGT